jgi:hypothetical protein
MDSDANADADVDSKAHAYTAGSIGEVRGNEAVEIDALGVKVDLVDACDAAVNDGGTLGSTHTPASGNGASATVGDTSTEDHASSSCSDGGSGSGSGSSSSSSCDDESEEELAASSVLPVISLLTLEDQLQLQPYVRGEGERQPKDTHCWRSGESGNEAVQLKSRFRTDHTKNGHDDGGSGSVSHRSRSQSVTLVSGGANQHRVDVGGVGGGRRNTAFHLPI